MEASPKIQLHSQAKEIIYNVNQYFQKKENEGVIVEVSKATSRTAAATKVSLRTLSRICKEGRDNEESIELPKFKSPKKRQRTTPIADFFDDFNKGVLRRTVLSFYERKDIPTLDKIHKEIKESLSYPGSRETLRKVLKKIGFQYAKVNGRRFLMERSDVAYARCKFLREMRKHLSCEKNIVYLDETWVNQNYTVSKCWVDNNSEKAVGVKVPTGKGGRLIVLHAGTKDGFVSDASLIFMAKNDGDYHNQMNAESFEKWFQQQLLPNIHPSSVIVMDNASYHSRRINTITKWLQEKGVQVSQGFLKAELMQLVRQHTTDADVNNYVIEKMASEHGHTVVRLPPYHCQYNPIELIWAQVKGYVSVRNKFKIADLKPLTHEAINSITKENWKNAVAHAERIQEEDARKDVVIDKFVDSFVITLTSSDEESE
ncbi:uncharacterized protein LOC126992421 [Eriocheir sinensis]|uniref:uncharacterized protein LOC126992421 n=1 Tax=Eriocheir sinensis TaxID=95602 RepID=UPI0021C68E6F|nr:uncharacterized protein LOC126992421 [Eriocheir sinensis]